MFRDRDRGRHGEDKRRKRLVAMLGIRLYKRLCSQQVPESSSGAAISMLWSEPVEQVLGGCASTPGVRLDLD